ncbi:MAG: glycosyltransferase [Pseudomonadota bacterium]
MSRKRVFFYVQHLWGVGHVYRATRIARGLVNAGMDVHLVWGGTRIPDFDFSGMYVHYLPAVRTSDVTFSELLNPDGTIFTEEDKFNRRDRLLSLFAEIRPEILMTEAFPFGRRQMLFELKPLLETAKTADWRPMISASIRDIMQEGRKEKRVVEAVNLVHEFYDLILVHGDARLIRIEETLQGAGNFLEKVRYTGLVTPDPSDEPTSEEFRCDVLVTVGGGAFGQKLTRTALEAMQHCSKFPTNWLVAAGTELSEDDFRFLKNNCPAGMRIVRHIPKLVNAMKSASVSVSHAGYNTVADIMRAGCASVLYPYADGNETEQFRRAQIIVRKDIATMLEPESLSPQSLANAVELASEQVTGRLDLDLDGASATAAIIEREFENLRQSPVD